MILSQFLFFLSILLSYNKLEHATQPAFEFTAYLTKNPKNFKQCHFLKLLDFFAKYGVNLNSARIASI